MHPPERIRALTRELVAAPSVSPDVHAESRCADLLIAHLPAGVEHGVWRTPDGRPVVWALAKGRTPRTVVLLGHYDTVGVSEYDASPGRGLAFDTDGLRRALLAAFRRDPSIFDGPVAADLEEEARVPGTWMFGRGALDMKSGLAAGLGALTALMANADTQDGSVLFVATPDEENQSAGMLVASEALLRMRDERSLDLVGVLNLDYSLEPAAYAGVMGKVELGCYLLGRLTHVGAPFDGVDALQLAAQVVNRVTHSAHLVDVWENKVGPPPVALHLDDLKQRYSIETATESLVEFNLIHYARPIAKTLERMRREVQAALDESHHAMIALAKRSNTEAARRLEAHAPVVLTCAELVTRADAKGFDAVPEARDDARRATLARLRDLTRAAGLRGPLAVLHVLPPFYPHALPGKGALGRAVSAVLESQDGVSIDAFYPFITDSSYVAWRGESYRELAPQFPALDLEYRLPCQAIEALDLDVVNLGPWGRDPHGVYERLYERDAFERLPVWLDRIIREVWRIA